jgi:hypothetical protein
MGSKFLNAICLGYLLVALPVCVLPAANEGRPLENADIIDMVQNHFDDETLQTVMRVHPCHFDTSAQGLIALKKGGVSEKIIRMMVIASQPRPTAVAQAAPSPPASASGMTGMPQGMPQMSPETMAMMQAFGMGGGPQTPIRLPQIVLLGKEPRALAVTPAQLAQSSMKKIHHGSSAASTLMNLGQEALQFASIGAGPIGMIGMSAASSARGMFMGMHHSSSPKITSIWALPGARSGNSVEGGAPSFEIQMADIVGIDPEAYDPEIVKLVVTKDNWRIVGASQMNMDAEAMMGGSESGQEITEDRMDVKVDKKAPGLLQIQPNKPLVLGEYGVILRPKKKHKPAPTGMMAARQLFYSVWDFSVP